MAATIIEAPPARERPAPGQKRSGGSGRTVWQFGHCVIVSSRCSSSVADVAARAPGV